MSVTIDQLIAKLNEAKAKIGGDKEVCFYQDTEHHYSFTTGMWGFEANIDDKIAKDKSFISFEIDRTDKE